MSHPAGCRCPSCQRRYWSQWHGQEERQRQEGLLIADGARPRAAHAGLAHRLSETGRPYDEDAKCLTP